MQKTNNINGIILFVLLACLLSGCAAFSEKVSDQQPLTITEDKPYPGMDFFMFEDVSFNFTLKLSHKPSRISDLPSSIDIEQTVLWNDLPAHPDTRERIYEILETFRNGQVSEISAISVNARHNKSLSIKGTKMQNGTSQISSDVTYYLETNMDLEMLAFKKETWYSAEYIKKNSFKAEGLIEFLIENHGVPHYTYVKANSTGIHKDFWWGTDDKNLISPKGYDCLNASHWNGFKGKTFFVSIHNYISGDTLIEQTMKDNFRAFHNDLTALSGK